MPRRPAALEQGALDGLCGIYSIVNGILWALKTYPAPRPHKRGRRLPSDAELGDLFVMLLSNLVQGHSHLKSIVDGTSSRQLLRLLSKSSDWLRENKGLALVTRRPFQGRSYVATARVTRGLGQHLARPGTAVILGVEAPLDHWTVVRRVTPQSLLLLDSGGASRLSMKEWGEGCRRNSGLVHPDNIFLLNVTKSHRNRKSAP